jgi:formylglycine-generating enzyme
MKTRIIVVLIVLYLSQLLIAVNIGMDELQISDNPSIENTYNHGRLVPNSPGNVTIRFSNGKVVLSWSVVAYASSYVVEASDTPGTGYSNLSASGTFTSAGGTVNWAQVSNSSYRFYRIKSVLNPMLYVAGGTFNNGTSNVTVSDFYINKYEVTSDDFEAVMGFNLDYFPNVVNGPANRVSWFEAIEYCNWISISEGITPCYSYLSYGTNPNNWPNGWKDNQNNHTNVSCNWNANGYRLPTEMEWWFAGRGGNLTHNYSFSGSNTFDLVGWYDANSGGTTHTIGLKVPNELGLYDMSGNVWEWVWDIYGPYPSGPQINPTGATSGNKRVVRGCSWYCTVYCTLSYPLNYAANVHNYIIGFRLCRRGT